MADEKTDKTKQQSDAQKLEQRLEKALQASGNNKEDAKHIIEIKNALKGDEKLYLDFLDATKKAAMSDEKNIKTLIEEWERKKEILTKKLQDKGEKNISTIIVTALGVAAYEVREEKKEKEKSPDRKLEQAPPPRAVEKSTPVAPLSIGQSLGAQISTIPPDLLDIDPLKIKKAVEMLNKPFASPSKIEQAPPPREKAAQGR